MIDCDISKVYGVVGRVMRWDDRGIKAILGRKTGWIDMLVQQLHQDDVRHVPMGSMNLCVYH